MQALAAFAQGEDLDRLRHLLSPAGHEEYKAWQGQSRSLLEVLEEFPSVKPPLGESPPVPPWLHGVLGLLAIYGYLHVSDVKKQAQLLQPSQFKQIPSWLLVRLAAMSDLSPKTSHL